VTLVIDAAPLVALADPDEPRRDEILAILRSESGGLFVPAPVTAEIDYLLGRRFGSPARRAFLDDLAARDVRLRASPRGTTKRRWRSTAATQTSISGSLTCRW
jgi:predicted nucleic acid-binding protein